MTYKPLYKYKLIDFSKIFFSFLIISININAGDFFYTKELFFILLIFSSATFGNYKNLWELLIILVIYMTSFSLNLIIPGSSLVFNSGLINLFGMLYLFLFVFNKPVFHDTIIKSYVYSALFVAAFIVVVWLLCYFVLPVRTALMLYFGEMDNGKTAHFVTIWTRKILFWWIPGVYYGTSPCLIPALGFFLWKKLDCKVIKLKEVFFILFLAAGLILTFARANMLAAIILLFAYFALSQLKKKNLMVFSFLLVLSFFILAVLVFLLLTTKEASLNVKSLHKLSYMQEFDSDLIRTCFYGWGAGSEFYSLGYKEITQLTELSLYETIRRYGFLSTCIIFITIWLKPAIRVFMKGKKISNFFLVVVLLSYIFVACTNPFLLGSIGFCALLFITVIVNKSTSGERIDGC